MIPYRQRGLMDRRHNDRERIDNMAAKPTRFTGRVLIVNAGEAAVDIKFPVVFSEMPIFTHGGALDLNHRATLGQYPTYSAMVTDWTIVGENAGFDGRFTGCRVAVVATGKDDQQMWLHYSFEGTAMRNPLNAMGSTEDVL